MTLQVKQFQSLEALKKYLCYQSVEINLTMIFLHSICKANPSSAR